MESQRDWKKVMKECLERIWDIFGWIYLNIFIVTFYNRYLKKATKMYPGIAREFSSRITNDVFIHIQMKEQGIFRVKSSIVVHQINTVHNYENLPI